MRDKKTYIPIVVAGEIAGLRRYERADTRQMVFRSDITVLTTPPVFYSHSLARGFSGGVPADTLSLTEDEHLPEANAVFLSRVHGREGDKEVYTASFCILKESPD